MAVSNAVLLALIVFTAAAINELNASIMPHDFRPPQNKRSCSLVARFDMAGIRGNITFYQKRADEPPVVITVTLGGLDQTSSTRYGWHIHEYPVTFGLRRESPCSQTELGGHYDPLNRASSPTYATDCRNVKLLCEVGDLAGKFGPLESNISRYVFEDPNLNLGTSFSPVGRSIIIHQADGSRFACANIDYDGDTIVETYRAPFSNPPIQGDIILTRPVGKSTVTLHAELYRADGGPVDMPLGWSLRAGDIKTDGSCTNLRQVYGSRTHQGIADTSRCDNQRQQSCFLGDLNQKCGRLNINNSTRRINQFCSDIQLGNYHYPQHLLRRPIAIENSDGTILACSRFEPVQPQVARADLFVSDSRAFARRGNSDVGDVYFTQTDPHRLTTATIFLLARPLEDGSYFQVRQEKISEVGKCDNLGAVFEPRPGYTPNLPLSPQATGDQVLIGDLRNKLGSVEKRSFSQLSSYLPLYGPLNIVGHSIVLVGSNGVEIACGNINRIETIPTPNIDSILGYHIV